MSLQTKSVFEFGPFRLDLAERLLTRDKDQIHLAPKAFDSLVVLVKNQGHLLEKDELLNQVWPGTFVEESNLAQHISMLRKALHDGEGGVRYIETVPRRGYRFVAEVREVQQIRNGSAEATASEIAAQGRVAGERHEPTSGDQPTGRSSYRSIVLYAGIVLFLVGVASYAMFTRLHNGRAHPVTSLAVLPLQNLSGDSSQDYFADGMTEALITDLAKIGSIRVISRTSAMQYKGSRLPLPQIAKQLNVDLIVEGAVLQAGDRVRVTAQLIRAADDQHIWAEEYERAGRDVLSLQGDLARSIAQKIKLQLTPNEQAELSNRKPVDPQAHEAYLLGRYFWNKRTVDDYEKSILSFQDAINKDPDYAEAYAGLADAYALMGSSGNPTLPRSEAMEKARAAALIALKLDEGLAEAHTSLAFVHMHYDWKFAEAEKEFRRAIELNPSYATAHHWYAYDLAATGRLQEALAEIERARQVDPLSVIVNTDVAEFLGYLHRYDEAVLQVQKALDLDPDFYLAHLRLMEIYDAQGRYPEALGEARKALALAGDDSWALRANALAELRLHRSQNADKFLRDLLEISRTRDVVSEVASIYVALDRKDEAFAWLEKAFQQRSGALILLRVDRNWEKLKSDPRYADLSRRVGFSNP